MFEGWHALVEECIASTPEHSILKNPAFDLAPLERWATRRIPVRRTSDKAAAGLSKTRSFWRNRSLAKRALRKRCGNTNPFAAIEPATFNNALY